MILLSRPAVFDSVTELHTSHIREQIPIVKSFTADTLEPTMKSHFDSVRKDGRQAPLSLAHRFVVAEYLGRSMYFDGGAADDEFAEGRERCSLVVLIGAEVR